MRYATICTNPTPSLSFILFAVTTVYPTPDLHFFTVRTVEVTPWSDGKSNVGKTMFSM